MIINAALTSVYYAYIALQFIADIQYDEASQDDNCIQMIQAVLGLNCRLS